MTEPTLGTSGIQPPAWVLTYSRDDATLARWDTVSTPDLEGAWSVRVFDGSREARWTADTGAWVQSVSVASVPHDDQRAVDYVVWSKTDRQLDHPKHLPHGDRDLLLRAVEILAEDRFGNRYVADEVLLDLTPSPQEP
jgi:hypothetical protein